MIHIHAVVMVLRVWALYNQSMLVLATLLTIYSMEEISLLVFYVVLQASGSASKLKLLCIIHD